MKRFVHLAFVAIFVLVAVALNTAPVQANGQDKEWLCHRTYGLHPWQAIEVAKPSVDGHLAHGDFYYNGPLDWLPQPGHQGITLADGWCEANAPQPTITPTTVPTTPVPPTPTPILPTPTPTSVGPTPTGQPTWQPTATFPPVGTPQVPSTGAGETGYSWWVPIVAWLAWPGVWILLGLIGVIAAGICLSSLDRWWKNRQSQG